jgi:replication factor C small subunit
MLWTERYRPQYLEELIGQQHIVRQLQAFVKTRTVPHLLISGPHGTGKSCAVACFARALFGEAWEMNITILPTADLFEQGKSFLENDDRYAHLYRKDASFITNFKQVTRWYASLRPLDAEFKLMVFEDAGALTREAQQALRRTMERYSATCRFILCTTNQSAIIPAISSRCLPLFFAPIRKEEIAGALMTILRKEKNGRGEINGDDLDLIAQEAQGDLRKAIMLLQVRATRGKKSDLMELAESETAEIALAAFNAMKAGDIPAAVKKIELLMIEYGLAGGEVITELRNVVRREYNDPRISRALADAEYRLGHASSEFVQLNALAARIAEMEFS